MTADKYVKKILKQLYCSSKRKKDIQKQLLADIKERIAQGNSVEDAISQIGSVQEIADSFNENISPTEQKKYKRNKLLIITTITTVLLTLAALSIYCLFPKTGTITESKFFLRNKAEVTVRQAIRLLDAQNYNTLQKMATPQMTKYLTKETIESAKKLFGTNWGKQETMGYIYIQELLQNNEIFTVCQVKVTYENASVIYTITLDDDMKISGLYMQ